MQVNVLMDEENNQVQSEGAEALNLYNLKVKVDSAELLELAKEFITFLVEYQIECDTKISSNQTLTYGFWIVQFLERNGMLTVFEMDPITNRFREGADFTLRLWGEQHYICEEANAEFMPPAPDKLVTVSRSILQEGNGVNAVRLENGPESSGWLLYGSENELDDIDGNMLTIYLHELIRNRQDLAPFLALPSGFRFEVDENGYDAWLDERSLL